MSFIALLASISATAGRRGRSECEFWYLKKSIPMPDPNSNPLIGQGSESEFHASPEPRLA